MSKEGKRHDPKKRKAMVKMLIPKIPQEIQNLNRMVQFYQVSLEVLLLLCHPLQNYSRKLRHLNGRLNVKLLGRK
jgi:hypothetical protein